MRERERERERELWVQQMRHGVCLWEREFFFFFGKWKMGKGGNQCGFPT